MRCERVCESRPTSSQTVTILALTSLVCIRSPPPRRYGGAYVAKEAEAVDPKIAIDAACHSGCEKVWDIYLECGKRIEEKGRGECSGYYMDYFKCIDKCATKKLFKELN